MLAFTVVNNCWHLRFSLCCFTLFGCSFHPEELIYAGTLRCLTCWLNLRWHCIRKKTLTLGSGYVPVVSRAYITKHLKNVCNFRMHIMGNQCLLKLTVVLATMFCLLIEVINVTATPFTGALS